MGLLMWGDKDIPEKVKKLVITRSQLPIGLFSQFRRCHCKGQQKPYNMFKKMFAEEGS